MCVTAFRWCRWYHIVFIHCPYSMIQRRRSPPCPWYALVEILNVHIVKGCPLPRRKYLGALALSKMKDTGLKMAAQPAGFNFKALLNRKQGSRDFCADVKRIHRLAGNFGLCACKFTLQGILRLHSKCRNSVPCKRRMVIQAQNLAVYRAMK